MLRVLPALLLLALAAERTDAQQQSTSYGSQIKTTYVLWSPPFERTASCTRLYEVPEPLRPMGLVYFYHISEPVTFRSANVGTDSAGRVLYLYIHLMRPDARKVGASTEVATLQWSRTGSVVSARHALLVTRDSLGGQDQVWYHVPPQEVSAAATYGAEALDLCRYRGQIPERPRPKRP